MLRIKLTIQAIKAIAIMSILGMLVVSASAGVITTFNVVLDSGDMEIADSFPNVNCFVSSSPGDILYAEIITFTPTFTDTYTISIDNVNPPDDGALVAVYSPNFVMGSAGTNCLDGTFDGRLTIELMAGQTYEIVTTINEFDYTGSYTVTIEDSIPSEESVGVPLDERLNRFDAAAPIAVYPNDSGGVTVYLISANSEGVFLFQTSDLENEACDSSLIAGDSTVGIYRTPDCTFQINAPQYNGKTYILRFDTIASSAEYTSYEE